MYSDSKNTKCKSTNENAGYRRRFLMLCLLLNVDSGALAQSAADPDEGVPAKNVCAHVSARTCIAMPTCCREVPFATVISLMLLSILYVREV